MRPTDWQASNVPEGKWAASLDRIPNGLSYVEVVRGYIEAFRANIEAGKGLILWGPNRGGKSSLAAIVVGEGLAYRLDSYWVEAFDVADAWIGKARGRRAALRGSQLLVIDDFGMELRGPSDFPKGVMQELLKYRLERIRPTIITTNMNPGEVRKVYGEKTWALLQEYMSDVLVSGAEDHWRKR